MTNDGKRVPDHLLIKIEQRDDPVSAVSEDDARHRSVAYPTLMWGAPIFGFAEEADGRWRILRLNVDAPQHARDGLASHFRKLHDTIGRRGLPRSATHTGSGRRVRRGPTGGARGCRPALASTRYSRAL